MPEWLIKQDFYEPQKDKDAFIDRSILSIMKVLARLKMQTIYRSNLYGISTLLKVISSILIIILASFTRNIIFILIINVYLLVLISLLSIDQIRHIIKMGAAAFTFTLIILIPSILTGNSANGIMVCLKVLACVTAVNITSCTSSWNDILSALKIFMIPDIFIFVLDITLKYIEILGDFSLNALYALKKRSIGRSNSKNMSLSGIMGTMFIKSKEMAEEMYGAMECRGFTGEYKLNRRFHFNARDYICIIINILFVTIYFYFDRL